MLTLYLSILETETDQTLFTEIYQQECETVYYTARNILRSHEDAEDACQNVWLYVAKNFQRIKKINPAGLHSYFIVMSRNASLNLLRKRKRTTVSREFQQYYERDSLQKAFENDNIREQANEIIGAILHMPEIYRQPLELKYIMGWKNKEIAKYLNEKQSTVESRIRRGRIILEKSIEPGR